jgi:hypothetical protein
MRCVTSIGKTRYQQDWDQNFEGTNLDLELQELDVLNCFLKHRADVNLKTTSVHASEPCVPRVLFLIKFPVLNDLVSLALVPLGTRFCSIFSRSLIRSLLFCSIHHQQHRENLQKRDSDAKQKCKCWNRGRRYVPWRRGSADRWPPRVQLSPSHVPTTTTTSWTLSSRCCTLSSPASRRRTGSCSSSAGCRCSPPGCPGYGTSPSAPSSSTEPRPFPFSASASEKNTLTLSGV